jgi:hypothetical protein
MEVRYVLCIYQRINQIYGVYVKLRYVTNIGKCFMVPKINYYLL